MKRLPALLPACAAPPAVAPPVQLSVNDVVAGPVDGNAFTIDLVLDHAGRT